MSTALQPAPPAPAPATQPAPPTPATPPIPALPPRPEVVDRLYRLSVEQYRAMAEANILGTGDRIELLEGLLVRKMTKNDPHMLATGLAQDALTQALPAGWFVSIQDPVRIAGTASEPEPDAKVVRGVRRDYANRRIGSGDVPLVIEVSDSSVREDQTIKKAIYALASIPIYWLLNLPAGRLEVYSDPTGPDPSPDYRRRLDLGPDAEVPLVLDGREVARISVRDLLP